MRAALGYARACGAPLLVAGLAALLALAPAAHAADPNLRGQWHLDTTAGSGAATTTPDSSGAGGGTGAFTGAPTLVPGRFASALNAGAANGWMKVVRPSGGAWGLEPDQQVSLTAWIRQPGFPGVLRYVAAKGEFPFCSGSSYALYTGYTAGGNAGLRFYFTDTAGVGHASPKLDATSTVWDGNWHAVTGTYDGTAVRLYLDGAEVGTGTPAGGAIKYAGATRDIMTVGTYPDRVAGPSCVPADWPGQIDEVRVHGQALTPAQITALHDRGATAPPDLGASGPPAPAPVPVPVGPTPHGVPRIEFAAKAIAAKLGGGTILDAGGTTGADRLLWDFNSDGRNDLVTPGTRGAVLVRPLTTSFSSLKLTATGPGGTVTTTPKITTIPSLLRPALAKTLRLPPAITTSASSGSAMVSQFGKTPLSNQVCLRDETVTFGFVEAQGCLNLVTNVNEVPAPERAVVQSHYQSPVFTKVVFLICDAAARGQRPQKDCDDAKEFFRAHYGGDFSSADPANVSVYLSRQPVKLNGLTVTPRAGAWVVLYPSQERLISSNAVLKWGSFTISEGAIDLNLSGNVKRSKGGVPEGSTTLLQFDPKRSVPAIAGFPLDGTVSLGLQVRGGVRSSFAALHVQLPPAFNLFGGNPPSGDVQVSASNADGGPTLDSLDLRLPEANLGAAYLRDVRFRYARNGGIDGDTNEGTSCTAREWKAQAALYIGGPPGPGATGVVLTPPPSQNGVGFCGGGFKHAGGKLEFARAARPQVFPGVFLDYIDLALQLDPTVLRGGGGLSVGDFAKVTGEMLAAFASPGQPYRLSPGDAGAELQQFAGKLLTSTTLAVGGTVKVDVPVFGELALFNGAVLYSYPGSVEFGGTLRVFVPGMSIEGGLNGWIQIGSRKFQLSGSAQACIGGLPFGCVGGLVMVGSRGMVACINVGGKRRPNGTYKGGTNPGAGYYWGDLLPHIWLLDGCKPSLYWEVASPARAAADRLTFRVAPGERAKELEIRGTGQAPRVRITAPGGEVLTLAEGTWAQTRTMSALRQEGPTTTTYAAVKNGRPGIYTIERLPGSAPLRSLAATRPGFDTNFRARVTGEGERRTLTYDVGRPSRKRVTFVERTAQGARELGTVTSGRGTIRFTPAPGAPGIRRIISVATLDGTPIPDQTLATFRVGNERIAAPAGVRVRRRGSGLDVSWRPVSGARKYAVVVRSAGGRTRALQLGAGARRASLRRVADTFGGRVVVTARDAGGRWSRPAVARYARVRAPYTALQTATHNERLAARRR